MRIGVIGCGEIASAVVQAIAPDGHQITLSQRSTQVSTALAQRFDNVTVADNQSVIDASDVVFLGLIADAAPAILGGLRFRPDQSVISFMAGATLDKTAPWVQPARLCALMMPFPTIVQGGSAVMVQGDVTLVQQLFGAKNTLFPIASAQDMAAYLSAQAILSPVTLMVQEAANWLAARTEDPAQAESFLRCLIASSLAASACAPLLDSLNTPGGYNQRLRHHLEASGLPEAVKAGLSAL